MLFSSCGKALKDPKTGIPIESFTLEGVKCFFGNQDTELGDPDEVVYFSSSTSISSNGVTRVYCKV